MEADSQDFFQELTSCPRTGFKGRFSRVSRRLGLSRDLKRSDLARLYEAAFLAALCNISFNGLGGRQGAILPQKELTRWKLEHAFMEARDSLYRCPGWKALAPMRKRTIRAIFLTVVVTEENLAP